MNKATLFSYVLTFQHVLTVYFVAYISLNCLVATVVTIFYCLVFLTCSLQLVVVFAVNEIDS